MFPPSPPGWFFPRSTALFLFSLPLLTGLPARAASPPSGTDATLSLEEDSSYSLKAEDFGFSDSGDNPADSFRRVKITTVPAPGILSMNGNPVKAGDFLPVVPVPGLEWTARGPLAQWRSIASSADGQKLVAAAALERLYTSTDAGATWTAREGNREWHSCASSTDGQKLVAVGNQTRIYTSSNAGLNWTPRDSQRLWSNVAISADGSRMLASVAMDYLYVSSDSGVTWTAKMTDVPRPWSSVASSADGLRLAATSGYNSPADLYLSADAGLTWTVGQRFPGAVNRLRCSADGSRLIAVGYGFRALSRDYGANWTVEDSGTNWVDAAISADGLTLSTAPYATPEHTTGDKIVTSLDGGATWMEGGGTAIWGCVTISGDGQRMTAGMGNGRLFTSVPAQPLLKYTPRADGAGTAFDSFTF